MGAKNTVQPAMPIRPDFAQVAWTLLDPQGQIQKEPSFAKNNAPKMFQKLPFI